MQYRSIVHQIGLPVSPTRAFEILCMPSAVRAWWGASRAIILPHEGGLWCAAWGEHEDAPEYVTAATIKTFDPPRRLLLADFKYFSRSGPLPFRPEMTTEFTVEAIANGSLLRVMQDRFPADPIADEFYAGCVAGWKNTFDAIAKFVQEKPLS